MAKKPDISATFVSTDTSFVPVHTNTRAHTQRMCVEEGAREGDEE